MDEQNYWRPQNFDSEAVWMLHKLTITMGNDTKLKKLVPTKVAHFEKSNAKKSHSNT